MRDFGFWVRLVAISQLFGLVLANYGDHWLSPDNPVLGLNERQLETKPVHRAATTSVSVAPVPTHDPTELAIEGWGGADGSPEPEAEDAGFADESEWDGDEAIAPDDAEQESDWGIGEGL